MMISAKLVDGKRLVEFLESGKALKCCNFGVETYEALCDASGAKPWRPPLTKTEREAKIQFEIHRRKMQIDRLALALGDESMTSRATLGTKDQNW